MATANANFDDVLSTTLNNHLPKLVDNIFTARPFFHFLNKAGQIRLEDGGAKIVIPIISETNSTAQTYTGSETLSVTHQDGITAAEYDWKQIAATVAITGIEEAKNGGQEKILSLLEAKTMQAQESLTEILDLMLIKGDPVTTGSETNHGGGGTADEWHGLGSLVKVNGNYSVGGINPNTYAFWQTYSDTTTESLTISDMTTAYNTTSVGADQPSFILTTQALYEKYESLLQPMQRFADASTADAGFQNLLFKGAPVCYDTNVTAGDMFFLNTKYLRLVGMKGHWFQATPFVRPNNVDARYCQIQAYGQLTVSNRKRQGYLSNKS